MTLLMARSALTGTGAAVAAMACVGSSVAVSHLLTDAPLFIAQALRYAAACVLLILFTRPSGQQVLWPRGREWAWLVGVAATGLALFNVAMVRGVEHAEPAVIGVAVACVPVLLALLGPLLAGRRPIATVVAGAIVVAAGAILAQGGGRTDSSGVAWAVLVLVCEVAFTLLAVPVLHRHGPWGLSVHATGMAALLLGGLSAVVEGPRAAALLRTDDLLAIAYLAVVVTALAFVLWYSAVARLGAAHAGLFTGVVPIAAACGGMLLGAPAPAPVVWAGIAAVVVGVALGLSRTASRGTRE
jgi:drug/metabolite transporter (DMT)-like permease